MQTFVRLLAGPSLDGEYDALPAAAGAADVDRARVAENERAAIAEYLHSLVGPPAVALTLLGLLAGGYSLLGAALWVWGAVVLARDEDRPCDQPLKGWLYFVLVWVAVDKMYCSYRYSHSLGVGSNIDQNVLPTFCSALTRMLVLGCGLWWFGHSETCARVSPNIYACVRYHLAFNTAFVVSKAIVCTVLVRLSLWMARNGRHSQFAQPPRRHAARAGLIDELATWRHEDVAGKGHEEGAGAGELPIECCVCQEGFGAKDDIKRTPCHPIPHYFHEKCLRTWLERYGRTCPVCRTDLEEAAGASI